MRVSFAPILFQVAVCCLLAAVSTFSVAQTNLVSGLPASPEDGGPRRWEAIGDNLQSFSAPSADTDVIEFFADGAVLSNLGCSEIAQTIWCEVRLIRGGPRGFVNATRLKAATGPDNVVPMGVDDSKRRAQRRDFDTKTEIPCAQERGQAMSTCTATVSRSQGGDATLVVTFANGFARQLYFVHGEFMRASATMSGVGTDTDWQIRGGVYVIRVDDQRYDIPENLIVTHN